MRVIRWIACHSLLLIALLAIALLVIFRQALVADFQRLTGSGQPVAAVATPAKPARPVDTKAAKMSDPGHTSGEIVGKPLSPGPAADPWAGVVAEATPGSESSVAALEQWPPVATELQEPAADVFPPIDATTTEPTPEMALAKPRPEAAAPGKIGAASAASSLYPPDDYDPETTGSRVADSEAMQSLQQQADVTQDTASSEAARSTGPVDDDYLAALETARRSYWAGDLDAAAEQYAALAEAHPERPDAAQELGNLLLHQQDVDGAARAYGRAIPALRQMQRDEEAIRLIEVISRYNRKLADSLYNQNWR